MSDKQSVLLVDDDVDLVDALEVAFEKEGFTVYKANSGEAGLKLAKEMRPMVIVLDVMMGEKHGFKVCEELKNDPATSSIGILIFSAMSGMDDSKHNMTIGMDNAADDFLEKPMKPSEVVANVRALIARG
jgi:two-component system, OmpR family, alkaline phosphatase synthesis response regulator PhoP